MPYGDRTGPRGQGKMTGKAAGLCTGFQRSRMMNYYKGRGGRGFVYGGFRRKDCGYFSPRRDWIPSCHGTDYGNWQGRPEYSDDDEMNLLRKKAVVLKQQLEDIVVSIQLLEKARDSEE